MRISDWSSDVCSSDLRVDNITQAVRVGTALPVRDVKRLTRLLCDKIETIEPGFGIEILTLTATIAEPIDSKQTVTSLIDDAIPDVSDLVDTLANRVGGRRLHPPPPVPRHAPDPPASPLPPLSPETRPTRARAGPRP